MPFFIQCDNKGCFKNSEALIDSLSNDVFCSECGGTIKNVTHFAKVQLKSLGQTTKKQKTSKAFSVTCKFCNKTETPKIKDSKVFCTFCDKELNYLSPPFIQAIKNNIKAL